MLKKIINKVFTSVVSPKAANKIFYTAVYKITNIVFILIIIYAFIEVIITGFKKLIPKKKEYINILIISNKNDSILFKDFKNPGFKLKIDFAYQDQDIKNKSIENDLIIFTDYENYKKIEKMNLLFPIENKSSYLNSRVKLINPKYISICNIKDNKLYKNAYKIKMHSDIEDQNEIDQLSQDSILLSKARIFADDKFFILLDFISRKCIN